MRPNLLAKYGARSVAKPISMLDIANIGALIMSEMPYCKLNHNVIRGTTMPAPKARTALVKMNFNKTFFDLLGRKVFEVHSNIDKKVQFNHAGLEKGVYSYYVKITDKIVDSGTILLE